MNFNDESNYSGLVKSRLSKYKLTIIALIILIAGGLCWKHWLFDPLKFFNKFVSAAAQQNIIIKYDDVQAYGWPWNIHYDVVNLQVKKQGGINCQVVNAGKISIDYNLWHHDQIMVASHTPTSVTFDLPSEPQLDISKFKGHLNWQNVFNDHHMVCHNIDFSQNNHKILHTDQISLQSQLMPTEPQSDVLINGYKIDANTITGQIPFDRIHNITAKFAIKGHLDDNPDLPQRLAAWSKSGGAIELSELTMSADKLILSCDGTFSIDHNLQPLATLTARVGGIHETIDMLAAQQKITVNTAKTYKMMLAMALMMGGTKGQTTISGKNTAKDDHCDELSHGQTTEVLKLSLTLQNGRLSMGPVDIYTIPTLNWQDINTLLIPMTLPAIL